MNAFFQKLTKNEMMFQTHKIRKAVFPVAGMGTRFLPATKASPKEMLPIVDKPLIQYAVEEAVAAGCTELVFITGRSKRSIEDHFDKAYELENELCLRQKDHLLAQVQNILPDHVTCTFIRQVEALGLGHAVLCAEPAIGNEPFAVILADDLIDAPKGALSQLLDSYQKVGSSVIGVQTIDHSQTESYGMVETLKWQDMQRIHHIVEKPKPEQTASNLAVVGRYILTPRIFSLLERVERGAGGEIQLTDAIAKLLEYEPVLAHAFDGKRYDCGNKLGYLEATVAFGLQHPETGIAMRELVKQYAGVGFQAALSTEKPIDSVAEPVAGSMVATAAAANVPEAVSVAEDDDDDEWVAEAAAAEALEEDVAVPAESMAHMINMLNNFMTGVNFDETDDDSEDENEEQPIAAVALSTKTETAELAEQKQPENVVNETQKDTVAMDAASIHARTPIPELKGEIDSNYVVKVSELLEQKQPENVVNEPSKDTVTMDAASIHARTPIPELKGEIDSNYVVEAPELAELESELPKQTDNTNAEDTPAVPKPPQAPAFQSLGNKYVFGTRRFVASNPPRPQLPEQPEKPFH